MAYTDQTQENAAAQLLLAGEKVRIGSLGAAHLGLAAGTYRFRLTLDARSDTTSALVRIFDSGATSNYSEVLISARSATIADNTGLRTATSLAAVATSTTRRYSWVDVLGTAVGEWVVQVSTAGVTASTPMVFSGFTWEKIGIETDAAILTTSAINNATAAYSLLATDHKILRTMSSGSANTLTLPLNATTPLEVGFEGSVAQIGAGVTSIAGEGGTTVNSAGGNLDISARYGVAHYKKTATNTWLVLGDLA